MPFFKWGQIRIWNSKVVDTLSITVISHHTFIPACDVTLQLQYYVGVFFNLLKLFIDPADLYSFAEPGRRAACTRRARRSAHALSSLHQLSRGPEV